MRPAVEGHTVMVLVMTKIDDKDDDKAGDGVRSVAGPILLSG